MRIFFATDIHGSDVCWRKFLNAGAFHKADVLVMGGDMTGKAMVTDPRELPMRCVIIAGSVYVSDSSRKRVKLASLIRL